MQVVILAAGKGTRMGSLTENTPKPLLRIGTTTLLEQKLHALPEGVSEIIIVIGYLGERIREHLGDSWKGIPITYILDEERQGTGGSLWKARELLTGPFLVLSGDDLFHPDDLRKLFETPHAHAAYAKRHKELEQGDYFLHDEKDTLVDMVTHEYVAPEDFPHRYAMNTSAYKLTPSIFEHPLEVLKPGEYGLPHTLVAAVRRGELSMQVLITETWLSVNTPEQLAEAERLHTDFFQKL